MIFYFSGTGNTGWAAERLGRVTGERLVNIAEAYGGSCVYSLEKDERIGFCFPVHGWRPPLLVRRFIGRLEIRNAEGHYCYALCTAGDTVGEAVDMLRKDLSQKGLSLHSAFSLIMPESYVGLPFMDVDKPDKERMKKTEADKALDEYARYIADRRRGVEKLVTGRWPRINSRIIGWYFTNVLVTDKPFHVVEDKCIRCGACADACPVADIAGGKGEMPEWRHNGLCLTCFACYHHCPVHAIEFGKRTKNKGQYYFSKNNRWKDEKDNAMLGRCNGDGCDNAGRKSLAQADRDNAE